jgi:hypothetical protein
MIPRASLSIGLRTLAFARPQTITMRVRGKAF